MDEEGDDVCGRCRVLVAVRGQLSKMKLKSVGNVLYGVKVEDDVVEERVGGRSGWLGGENEGK